MSTELKRFVNPYNFIPFDENGGAVRKNRKNREENYHGKEQLNTGWLEVEMSVKTPLIIPDGSHPHYIDVKTHEERVGISNDERRNCHKKYDFYHIGGESDKRYIVPGSEIRGMIRGMYEAVTDSCFPFLLSDKPISQRVPIYGSVNKRGLLEYDIDSHEWRLWSAVSKKEQARIVPDNKQTKDACKAIVIGSKKYACGEYIEKIGYVQCNIPVDTRKPYHVVFLQPNKIVHTWIGGESAKEDTPYRQMSSILRRDNVSGGQKNPNNEQRKSLLNKLERVAEKGGMIPVYYFIVDKDDGGSEVYMSNSSIGRIAQHRKWKDIIDDKYQPCGDTNHLCPACMLFGTKEGKGIQGHVRFTDATTIGELRTEYRTLDILGQPRTSSYEFYLDKPCPDAAYWNFDFYGVKKEDDKGNVYTEYRHLDKSSPRGRKMYWNGKPRTSDDIKRLNSTMECVERGSFFFRVFFDRITEDQLSTLIWTLCLGENSSDSSRWHKLGHARPLGYGSVKMRVTRQYIRKLEYDVSTGAKITIEDSVPSIRHTPLMVDDISITYLSILAMSDYRSVEGKEVRYPRLVKKNKDEVFNWFADNHTNSDRLRILPLPTDSDITLEGSWFDDCNSSRKGDSNKDYKSYKTKLEHDVKYKARVTEYKEGRDGKPFFVCLEIIDKKESVSMPYYFLEKGSDAQCVPIDKEYEIIYSDCNKKGFPNWKKV